MLRRIVTGKSPLMKGTAFRVLLTLLLALPLLAASPVITAAQVRVQSALLDIAAQHPDEMVSVIVQKSVQGTGVEEATRAMGGTLTRDLHIINAFSATVPARVVARLAQVTGVRWISLDAPVTKSSDGVVTPVQTKGTGSGPQPSGTPFSAGGNKDPNSQLFDAGSRQFTTWASDLPASSTSAISTGFVAYTINAGSYIWFNSALQVTGTGESASTVNFDQASIQVSMLGQQFNLPIPNATITYDPAANTAATTYDAVNGRWVTVVPARLAGSDIFLSGMAVRVPTMVPGVATAVTVTGRFTTDTPGARVTGWKWSAATYSNFSGNNALGVKPCSDGSASQWHNSDNAGTPENYKSHVIAGARGLGAPNYTGTYSSAASVVPARLFNNGALMVDGARGPNGTYGYGSAATQAFAGFVAERSPGQKIGSIEVALQAYVLTRLSGAENPTISVSVDGQTASTVTLPGTAFDTHVGAANAGTIYVDVTGSRNWTWGDFDNNLQVTINQAGFTTGHPVYYDAVGLRVSTTGGTDTSGGMPPTSMTNNMVDTSVLQDAYPQSVRATDVWNGASGRLLQGQGMTVAVVDSGVVNTDDLKKRVIASVNFDHNQHDSNDNFGHGTFVAGIIAGDGKASQGQFTGIAPRANIVSVRISGDDGSSTESDLVASLQWLLDNKDRYNVRVVNLSLNSSVLQSYHTSPLDAAVEILWFNKIVVVVSAGNNGTANLFPPANDPFVITVGATDDHGTTSISDDTIASFSAWGTAENGAVKPEIVAPGTNIVSLLPDNSDTVIGNAHSNNRVNANYFRMSGTSMAAPMVSGAVALLLQNDPNLNPDQVKYRLMATAARGNRWAAYNAARAGSGYVDVYAAVTGTTTQAANMYTRVSRLLWTGPNPVSWQSVNWDSVNWDSVNWDSVNWDSVNWDSVNWSSDTW